MFTVYQEFTVHVLPTRRRCSLSTVVSLADEREVNMMWASAQLSKYHLKVPSALKEKR